MTKMKNEMSLHIQEVNAESTVAVAVVAESVVGKVAAEDDAGNDADLTLRAASSSEAEVRMVDLVASLD